MSPHSLAESRGTLWGHCWWEWPWEIVFSVMHKLEPNIFPCAKALCTLQMWGQTSASVITKLAVGREGLGVILVRATRQSALDYYHPLTRSHTTITKCVICSTRFFEGVTKLWHDLLFVCDILDNRFVDDWIKTWLRVLMMSAPGLMSEYLSLPAQGGTLKATHQRPPPPPASQEGSGTSKIDPR